MPGHEPVDPRVRLAIAQWPDDAPRGAVSTSCVEHGISRKSFYELRIRASVDGPATVLEPRSRRPRSISIEACFPASIRTRCWFHRLANIRAKLPNEAAAEVMAHVHAVRDAPTLDAARAAAIG